MPLVSVIVPVHNVAPYLQKCVDSIKAQDLTDIEIILSENLSTDDSWDICRKLAETDDRIRLLRLDAAGLSLARNAGIEAASAEYVCFIDSDDTIEPDMLSAMYAGIQKYGADLAVCNYVIDYPDRPPQYNYPETGETRFYTSAGMLSELLQEHICSSACVMMCRKRLFDDIKFPVGRYFEDHATTYRIVDAATGGCVHIARSLYRYIQRPASICHSPGFRKKYDFALASLERIRFINGYGRFSPAEKRRIFRYNIKTFVINFVGCIEYADSKEKMEKVEELRAAIPFSLAFKTLSYKEFSRLMRIRYNWKAFCRNHGRNSLE